MNVAASIALLLACGFVEFNKNISDWSVDQALTHLASGDASALQNFDLTYTLSLGPSSLEALIRLRDELTLARLRRLTVSFCSTNFADQLTLFVMIVKRAYSMGHC